MVERDDMPLGCDVNVKASFFLYDQIRDRYLVIEDSLVERRYHNMMSEWGFTDIISHDDLKEISNGYLVNDCIILGVEVFVLNNTHKGESLSFVKEPENSLFTWKIDNFSLYNTEYVSDVFDVKGITKLRLGSKEGSNKEENLFLYLSLDDSKTNPQSAYAEFTLRIMDRIKDSHIEKKGDGWFEDASDWMKSPESLSLSGLKNRSNDYLVDNKLIIQAKISCMCVVKTF
uniref:MATH domain-containing protein n=1 Tax=Populus trichocarpa TaxID=3694 RepID=A0A3N7G8F7_POPTR